MSIRGKSRVFVVLLLVLAVMFSLAFVFGRYIFIHVEPVPVTFLIGPGGTISYHIDIKDPRKDFKFVSEISDVEVSQSKPYELQTSDQHLLIIIRRQVGSNLQDQALYLYTDNSAVHIELNGQLQIDISDNRVFINAAQARVQSISFRPLGFKVPTPTTSPRSVRQPASQQPPTPVPTYTPIPFIPIQSSACPTATTSATPPDTTGSAVCEPATPAATATASGTPQASPSATDQPTPAATPSVTPNVTPSATP